MRLTRTIQTRSMLIGRQQFGSKLPSRLVPPFLPTTYCLLPTVLTTEVPEESTGSPFTHQKSLARLVPNVYTRKA